DRLGNASEQHARETLATVGTHDDEIDVALRCVVEDLVGWCSTPRFHYGPQLAAIDLAEKLPDVVVSTAPREWDVWRRILANACREVKDVEQMQACAKQPRQLDAVVQGGLRGLSEVDRHENPLDGDHLVSPG